MSEQVFGYDPTNLTIPVNLMVSVAVGLTVGSVEDVPISWMPDILAVSLAFGFILQEIFLVQRTSWPSRKGTFWMGTGEYEMEAKKYEEMLRAKFSPDSFSSRRFSGWERRAVYILPFATIFSIGMVLLMFSDRDLGMMSVARVLSVTVILVLGMEPILGTLDQRPIATIGAAVIYGLAVYLGFTGYPHLALDLEARIGSFSSLACSAGALSYLLLSARWSYYKAFCYNEMDDWLDFCLKPGIPLIFILYPQFPEILDSVIGVFVGA
ncbi:MAG: hypothetical protein CL992_04720 [Euryarchaeota archaeon]|nr:hypothetical protein [Euryarchaeota archaeon]